MNKSISRLVFCSKNKSYLDALEILFINSQKIPKLKAGFYQDLFFLIEVSGDSKEGRRTMETGILEWKNFLEKYKISFDRETKEDAKNMIDLLFGQGNLTTEALSSYPWLHTPTQKKGIVSSLLKNTLLEYERESSLLKKLMAERDLISLLSDKDISIIETWAQIGVCHMCKTFEMISTTQGTRAKKCPSCNQQNLTATIYGFDENFQKHFINNKVLPLFCAGYINDLSGKQVATKQKINDGDGNSCGDIDVYVPQTQTGIECKLMIEHEPSDNQFQNHYAEIQRDLKKYLSFGIKNLVVITNIEEHRANTLKQRLQTELSLNSEVTLQIIHHSVPLLLKILSNIAESVKQLMKNNDSLCAPKSTQE